MPNDVTYWLLISAPLLASLGGLVGAALVAHWTPAHELAVGGADYVEALKEAVSAAERIGLTRAIPGADKFAIAIKYMDAWLDNKGIHGDAKRITLRRVEADVELLRARMFPSKPKVNQKAA